MMRKYHVYGVCAKTIDVDTDGDTVLDAKVHGGCRGQANALPRLVRGMKLDEAIRKLRGVQCRNGTSCADQLGRVLEKERDRLRSGDTGTVLVINKTNKTETR